MSVMIRLSRQGAKKKPQYIVIATDKTNRRDGEYLEKLGFYRPNAKQASERFSVDQAKLATWVKNGAILSETVGQLLRKTPKSN